ncbi:hypothetical protein WDU94_010550 [Cyamophila willieti]
MLSFLVKVSVVVLIYQVQLTHNILLQSIYQKYLKQQGLEFRENVFLGNKPILPEYDFIIVGGGVAGSVLANRLSENATWKVLLLEAGEDENIYTNIPLLAHFNSLTHFNWGYKLEKEETHPQCMAMYNNQCPCPRGKGLGGSSILNYMIYTRGNKKDYDAYETAGNKGWGYDSVLKYFLKSENNTSEFLDDSFHSNEGPLKVTNIPYTNLLTEKFTQAICEMGYPLYDYTGKDPATEGFSKLQATISKGQRYSANRAYLKSVKKRTSVNLHISIFSQVTRILIDPNTRRAHGVEFYKNGVKRVVLAKKEVILSAGAIGSPQLLMLSGVGPEKHLKEFNIDVVSNLKGVGQNMGDHHSFFGITFIVNKTMTGSTIEKEVLNVNQFLKWLNLHRGPLSVPGGVSGIGYMNTKYNTDKSWPDTEYLFTIGGFNSDGGRILRKSMNIRKDIYDSVYGHINNRESWSIIPVVLRPKVRGSVKLKSKNPFKYPKIYYDFFENEEDTEVLLESIKNVIRISETEAFQSIGSRLHKTPIPDCAHFEFGCDDYWRCAMKYFTSGLYHQCGTCKMGPQSDPEAVVNDQLKVYGVTNLRVVDSSVFPSVPSAHLYAPTVMVAEKASDMIKDEWKNVPDENPHKNSGCYSQPNPETGYQSPHKTSCNSNKPNQLDNQKPNTTRSSSTTAKPYTTTATGDKLVVPNQPNYALSWQNYANKTWGNKPTVTSPNKYSSNSTYQPYIPNQLSSTYTPYIPNRPSSTYPPYIPNQDSSSTYPPYIPNQPSSTSSPYIHNQQPNGYPNPPNNPLPGSSQPFSNQQYPQETNGYPNPPIQPQSGTINNYLPPPSQYPNQSSLYRQFSYPSDHYQIHTIYPGSGPPVNGGYQQSNIHSSAQQTNLNNLPYPPPPSPTQEYYHPTPINGVQTSEGKPPSHPPQNMYPHNHPYHPTAPLATNEVESLQFPQNNYQQRHPAHQNAPQVQIVNPAEDINYSGLNSLHSIPYYNQNLNQLRLATNVMPGSPGNQSLALFLKPDMLYQSRNSYYKRSSRQGRQHKTKLSKKYEKQEENEIMNQNEKTLPKATIDLELLEAKHLDEATTETKTEPGLIQSSTIY